MSKNKNGKKENFYISAPSWYSPDCTGSNSESSCSEAINNIIETGSITVKKGENVIHCLTIIGQVEGHYILPAQNKTTKYEHVIPQLVAIEESDGIDGLILILNTVGGDIEAGLAIAELISGMETKNRQSAINDLIKQGAQAIVVVGGKHSNNTCVLVKKVIEHGIPAFHVESDIDIDIPTLSKFHTIGIISGASTHDDDINNVINLLKNIT